MSELPQRAGAVAYRPDIDGLRALAVLAVIFYHAGVRGFTGGYVGVDVFFVISGYLITQFLQSRAMGEPRTMVGDFYLRRIRRILPALLVTCATVALLGWWLLMPGELVLLGKQLTAAPVFLSNLAAWSEGGGYFSHRNYLSSPLRHLWSIAVEEQFYLLYPLLLVGLARYLPRRQVAVIAVLALLSLLLCIWASHHRAGLNYYALPTRAWELLLGGLLGLSAVAQRSPAVRDVTAAAALAALAAAVWRYDPAQLAYPGAYTLLPCLATAALLMAGRGAGSVPNRLLAWPPLVFVGLISYSLYLWHLPLLALASYYSIGPLSALQRTGVLSATFALAVLSWRLIEQPVRQRALFRSPRALLRAAILASAVVLAAGLLLWRSDGFPQRLSVPERALLVTPDFGEFARCMNLSPAQIRAGRVCRFGPAEGAEANVVLWGDSHALTWLRVFEALSARRHMALYFVAKASCWPLLASVNSLHEAREQATCTAFNAAAVDLARALKPSLVILGGHWNDQSFAPAAGLEVADSALAFTAAMRQTLQGLAGAGAVCVVFDVPQLKFPGSHALLIAQRRGIPDDFLTLTRADALAPVREMEGQVRALAQAGVLRFADPKSALCPGETCLYKAGGRSLYWDSNHLSATGAAYAMQALDACFEPAVRTDAAGATALPTHP